MAAICCASGALSRRRRPVGQGAGGSASNALQAQGVGGVFAVFTRPPTPKIHGSMRVMCNGEQEGFKCVYQQQ